MAPTGWPAIPCWKRLSFLIVVISTASSRSIPISTSSEHIPDWNAEGTTEPDEMILITQSLKELQLLMSDYVGIVRTHTRLQRASKRLDLLHEEIESLYETTAVSPQLCEVRNLITVGYLIVKEAQFRKESRGLHYNTDYPRKEPYLTEYRIIISDNPIILKHEKTLLYLLCCCIPSIDRLRHLSHFHG